MKASTNFAMADAGADEAERAEARMRACSRDLARLTSDDYVITVAISIMHERQGCAAKAGKACR